MNWAWRAGSGGALTSVGPAPAVAAQASSVVAMINGIVRETMVVNSFVNFMDCCVQRVGASRMRSKMQAVCQIGPDNERRTGLQTQGIAQLFLTKHQTPFC